MAKQTAAQRAAKTAAEAAKPTREPELRLSTINVDLDLYNEWGAPVKLLTPVYNPDGSVKRNLDGSVETEPKVFTFIGDPSGTAEEKLIAWAKTLELQLTLAADAGRLATLEADVEAGMEGLGHVLELRAAAAPGLEDATKETLRAIAKKYGLPVSGNRAELIARIAASEQYQADQQ